MRIAENNSKMKKSLFAILPLTFILLSFSISAQSLVHCYSDLDCTLPETCKFYEGYGYACGNGENGGAICGNGNVESAEQCDDGNTNNGDGCSDRCEFQCVTPPNSLVSWWPGDNNANDIQDGNNGALVNGTTFTAGKVGQAFEFDGVNDYVLVNNSTNLNFGTGAFTVDAWIKTTGTSQATIVSKGKTTSSPSWYMEMQPSGVIRAGTQNGNGDFRLRDTTTTVNDGSFHHVAAVISGFGTADIDIYIDGVLSDTTDVSGGTAQTTFNNDDDLYIGSRIHFVGNGNILFFDGEIDEVEIFNRSLSSAEINLIFNADIAGKCKEIPVRVCKIIIDGEGEITDGSEFPGINFTIPSDFGIHNFTTPLSLNSDLIGDDQINDAQCFNFTSRELDRLLFYSEEIITPNKLWEEPRYNDDTNPPLVIPGDFSEFNLSVISDGGMPPRFPDRSDPRILTVLNQFRCTPEEDEDDDGVCEKVDRCPDSKPNEIVDKNGCDAFQFCGQIACGPECFSFDFMEDEPEEEFPNDCMVVVIRNEGTHFPKCIPVDELSCRE